MPDPPTPTPPPSSDPTKLSADEQIIASLRRIIRAVDLHSRKLMEHSGMTGPQLAALQEIHRRGAVSAGDVARAIHLSQGTVTGILGRLESRGYITRSRSETDRRATVIRMTPAGKAVLAQAPSLLQDSFLRRLESLAEWERTQILATLQRVAHLMEAQEIDAAPHLTTTIQPPPKPSDNTRPPKA